MIAQPWKYTKNHWVMHFQRVTFILCELYFNKVGILRISLGPNQHLWVVDDENSYLKKKSGEVMKAVLLPSQGYVPIVSTSHHNPSPP